jgi:hypothetical protein
MADAICTGFMANLLDLTNAELRDMLSDLGLDTKGKKSELVERIEAHNDSATTEEEQTTEEAVEEIDDTETVVEVVEELDPYVRFGQLFNVVFNNPTEDPDDLHSLKRELKECADLTSVKGYKCDPTDGWKLWIGPTKSALLCNETKDLAFACNRPWWHTFYHGASLCYIETCTEEDTVFRMRDYFHKRGRFVNRVPVPGYEIKLPASKLEIINMASGSWA